MPATPSTKRTLAILGVVGAVSGWIGSSFLWKSPAEPRQRPGTVNSLERRPNHTLEAIPDGRGPTFRAWFASLKPWAHSRKPSAKQVGELRTTAASVRVNAAGGKIVDALTRAVTEELEAKGTPGSSTSLAAAAEMDFKTLFQDITAVEKPDQKDMTAIVSTHAARTSSQAIEFLQKQDLERDELRSLLWIAYPYWALHDGEAALEAALSSGWDRHLLNAITNSWALIEPAKVGAAILKHRKELVQMPGSGPGTGGWDPAKFCRIFIHHSPAAALKWLKGIPDEGFRHMMTKAMIPELAAIDSARALELLHGLPPALDPHQDPFGKFMDRWANADPRGVLEWARGQEDNRRRCTPIGKALAALARHSTHDAAEVFKSLEVPRHTHDPNGNPLVYIEPEFTKACQQVARDLIERDPALAEEWLNSLPDDTLAIAMPAVYWSAWETLPPEEAWDYISTKPDDKAKAEVLPQLVAQQARTDPAEALRLASELEEGPTQDFAVRNAILELVKVNPARAREFVDGMVPSPTRDLSLQDVAQTIASDNPEQAIAIAAQIQDGRRRSMVTANAVTALAELDPGAALRFLDGPASESIGENRHRERIREQIERSRQLREFLRQQ